jgi:hypothetical protein
VNKVYLANDAHHTHNERSTIARCWPAGKLLRSNPARANRAPNFASSSVIALLPALEPVAREGQVGEGVSPNS